LFHVATIVNRAVVTIPGASSGRDTWKNVRNSPAPSTRAASSSSVGTAWSEKIHIRYRPNVDTRLGMIMAHGVFVRFSLANSRNCGTARAMPGTEMAPMITANTALRPGKRNFARPYPPMMASRVAPPAPTTTYRIVFRNQRPKMPSW